MAEIHDKVRELLEKPILRKGLEGAFYTGLDTSSAFQDIDLADHLRRARGEQLYSASDDPLAARFNTSIDGLPKKLIDVFQEIVIDNLPDPPAITAEELASIAIAQLTGLPLLDTENNEVVRAYRRFVTFALSDMDDERLGVKYFAFGRWLCEDDDEYEVVFPGSGGETIWSSPSGFSLSAFATGRDPSAVCANMVCQLSAHCSELALDGAEADLGLVIESIAKTTWLCLTREERMHELPSQIADRLEINEVDWGCGQLTYLTRGDGSRILSNCLSAYWCEPNLKKDTLFDRLRNATVLLSYADQAGADSIGRANAS